MATDDTVWILYDGRAEIEGPDEASVLETARNEREAIESGKSWIGTDAIWFQSKGGREIPRYDVPPRSEWEECCE